MFQNCCFTQGFFFFFFFLFLVSSVILFVLNPLTISEGVIHMCFIYGKRDNMPSYSWLPSKYIQHQNKNNTFSIFSGFLPFFSLIKIYFCTHPAKILNTGIKIKMPNIDLLCTKHCTDMIYLVGYNNNSEVWFYCSHFTD